MAIPTATPELPGVLPETGAPGEKGTLVVVGLLLILGGGTLFRNARPRQTPTAIEEETT